MKIIYLTNKGTNGSSGFYIGRGTDFGNPYLTKPSKYPGRIYRLSESLDLFEKDILSGKIDITPLIDHILVWDILKLNCFCINRTITKDSNYNNIKCHGEVISKCIFDSIRTMKG